MRMSVISAAVVAALVGFGASVAIVLAGAQALGATPAQAASWLLVISLAKGLGSAGLSSWARVPVVLAWSTPGAALIAASSGLTMAQGVAAFVTAGVLILLTGLIRRLGALIALIPDAVAAAMLAGVLLPFVLKLAPSTESLPVLWMIGLFLILRLWNGAIAVLAAVAVGLALSYAMGHTDPMPSDIGMPFPVFVAPDFDLAAIIGLGIPLYLVTMASQNLPGFAIMRAAGFAPPVAPALITTGALSAGTALFGAHTINMAAITAAICMGDDVHPDRSRRWVVGVVYGLVWVCLGLSATWVVAMIDTLPTLLVQGIVGLALLMPLTGALGQAFVAPEGRFAATVTLIVAASGFPLVGISSAFWGLCAGLLVTALNYLPIILFGKDRMQKVGNGQDRTQNNP
jgi:benzoate membrane transport protein